MPELNRLPGSWDDMGRKNADNIQSYNVMRNEALANTRLEVAPIITVQPPNISIKD